MGQKEHYKRHQRNGVDSLQVSWDSSIFFVLKESGRCTAIYSCQTCGLFSYSVSSIVQCIRKMAISIWTNVFQFLDVAYRYKTVEVAEKKHECIHGEVLQQVDNI